MVKCLFFGGIVAVTGCYFGFRTSGGAEGVGRSTTDSVVYAILAVLVSDYFLEKVLLAL
jgi:phospholipid/cholesterol/gamma-HCH transport system permease protein